MTSRVAVPPPEGFVRVRMQVAYDGSGFHGFARNDDVVTVQGVLEDGLTKVLRHPTAIACAGRTDAGVHSRGQVVSFDADGSLFDPVALDRAMNRLLPEEITVDRVEQTTPDFDARLSCVGRTYRYHVLNRRVADPLTRGVAWHVREPLDLDAMRLACDQIIGLHDFTSFSKRNKSRPEETFLRRVKYAEWHRVGEMMRFEIRANAFSHQMVRSLVGSLVDVGRGRRRAVEVGEMLRALDRGAAPSPAPSHGLVFWRAHYQ